MRTNAKKKASRRKKPSIWSNNIDAHKHSWNGSSVFLIALSNFSPFLRSCRFISYSCALFISHFLSIWFAMLNVYFERREERRWRFSQDILSFWTLSGHFFASLNLVVNVTCAQFPFHWHFYWHWLTSIACCSQRKKNNDYMK